MLNLPSLPTDNLYKFIAIGGMLLFGAGIVLPVVIEQEQFDLKLRRQLETEDRMRSSTFRIADIVNSERISDDAKRERVLKQIDESLHGVAKIERESLKGELAKREEWAEQRITELRAVSFVGLGLTVAGFLLWYFRVQRYQDKLIQLDAMKAEKELHGHTKKSR